MDIGSIGTVPSSSLVLPKGKATADYADLPHEISTESISRGERGFVFATKTRRHDELNRQSPIVNRQSVGPVITSRQQ